MQFCKCMNWSIAPQSIHMAGSLRAGSTHLRHFQGNLYMWQVLLGHFLYMAVYSHVRHSLCTLYAWQIVSGQFWTRQALRKVFTHGRLSQSSLYTWQAFPEQSTHGKHFSEQSLHIAGSQGNFCTWQALWGQPPHMLGFHRTASTYGKLCQGNHLIWQEIPGQSCTMQALRTVFMHGRFSQGSLKNVSPLKAVTSYSRNSQGSICIWQSLQQGRTKHATLTTIYGQLKPFYMLTMSNF